MVSQGRQPQRRAAGSSKRSANIQHVEATLGSVTAGHVSTDTIRASLQSTYALAADLRSSSFVYQAKKIEVAQSKHVTSEQIWGQLNVLLAPILSTAQRNMEGFQALMDGHASEGSESKAPTAAGPHAPPDVSDGDDANEEDDTDEGLLSTERGGKKKKASKKADADAWRYAFGMDNGAEEEDEEDNENDDADADLSDGGRRARRRNDLALRDAEDEDGAGEEYEEGDEDDEKAALKELYGSDFSDEDGARMGELDEEDEEDNEEGGENEDDSTPFNEEDGKYWGDANILEEAEEYDEHAQEDDELDAELANPDLTPLERERLLERRRMESIEKERLFNAPWAMTGEVGGSKRPKDSLLQESLDFEHAMRPVPVVTEFSTAQLEDRIKRRINDKNFDDVQRRASRSTADDLVTTRRDAGVESEKSKLSLMDLYEKDYLEKMKLSEGPDAVASAEPLTEIEKDELRAIQMWKRLSQHLDALSNFFYTPKPVQQDLDARVRAVENQAPAIAIEHVGNLAVSRESALAPQDVYRPSNHAKAHVSVEEMDPKEKRALRRAKKEVFAATKERKDKKHAVVSKVFEAKKAAKAEAKLAAASKKRKR